jgi:glycosyltransferase involved in cell wall biosynthesis
MRILHVMKVTGVAGAENHLLLLLERLRQREIDAHMLYLTNASQPVDEFMAALEERGIPSRRAVIRHSADPLTTRRLRDEFRQTQPHIVHTHLIHADLYGIPAARLLRVEGKRPRIVSSKHNDDAFRSRPELRAANRALWRMTDKGIAISEAVRRFSIETEGAKPEQIQTIYYGYPAPFGDPNTRRKAAREALNIATDEIIIGATCRLIAQKGLIYGIRAFAQIAERYPQARLIITGDGDQRAALENEARTLGITAKVRFLGWRSDAAALMPAYDIFLMPSLWEGFGLVLLEAMGASVPIVGSRVSAIPEVVQDGETGLLTEPRDVDALADHLALLLADAPLRRHMGMMGRERLETAFSVEKMVSETAAVYESLLKTSK